MAPIVLHGLIQKAKLDAEALPIRLQINTAGQIWKHDGFQWRPSGTLPDKQDREDFLVAQLTQEDR